MNIKDKKILSDMRMSRAREFLTDAQANFEEQRFRTAVNRAYYASLSAIRALLILEGINPETHEGVLTMLSLRFVKTEMLPVSLIKNFKALFSKRTDVDYGDFDTTSVTDAEESLKIAGEIIEAIDTVRERLIKEMS